MSRCFIAGAGEYCGTYTPKSGDYIVAADGGYAALVSRGITPDVVVGDFDSLETAPRHKNIIRAAPEKDDTDMLLAIKQGFTHGCSTFVIDGGMGGRFDHTFANIQLLAYIARRGCEQNSGARGYLLGRGICITAVTNGSVGFSRGASGGISVFSFSPMSQGVTLAGLKYSLSDAVLTCDYPIGVSNEFTGAPAAITVRDGTLIVTWSCGMEFIRVEGEQ